MSSVDSDMSQGGKTTSSKQERGNPGVLGMKRELKTRVVSVRADTVGSGVWVGWILSRKWVLLARGLVLHSHRDIG